MSWLRVESLSFWDSILECGFYLKITRKWLAFVYLIVIAVCAYSNVEFETWWRKMKQNAQCARTQKHTWNVLRLLPDIHAAFQHLKCVVNPIFLSDAANECFRLKRPHFFSVRSAIIMIVVNSWCARVMQLS